MSQIVERVFTANADLVGGCGEKSALALPPARRFAVLTCMDAWLDPARSAGLAEGDAHVIRDAGGRDGWRDTGNSPGSDARGNVSGLTISPPHGAVVADVRRVRSRPLVPLTSPIHGYLFDVETGGPVEVPEAAPVGAAASPRT